MMKKKISMVLAGLGLCASVVVFFPQDAEAGPCVARARPLSGPDEGACSGPTGSCQANICIGGGDGGNGPVVIG